MKNNAGEKEFYEPIKRKLEELIRKKFGEFYLEITADKQCSSELSSKMSYLPVIVQFFRHELVPDITGYIKDKESTSLVDDLKKSALNNGEKHHLVIRCLPETFDEAKQDFAFIVVEVKKEKIKLDDIYQIKKYSDLFKAGIAILVTLKEIPEEVKRLSKVIKKFLPHTDDEQLVIAHFNHQKCEFEEWFPGNPFK